MGLRTNFDTLARACVLLGAIGAVRIVYVHFVREDPRGLPAAHAARIEDRYRALKAALPARGRVVYLSDAPLDGEEGARRYVQALYSLAPLVLMKDDGRAQVAIADLRDPSRLPALEKS